MNTLLKQIKDVMWEFVTWFWNGIKPPERKKWCAIFYFVAQEDPGIDYPDTSLDIKLEATIDALNSVSFDSANTHIVYRAIWAETTRDPIAKVISSSFLPPETDFIPGCSLSTFTPIDTGNDLPCFLKWAYKWCPADHYAIFFWGHSFGPAGLFEPGGPVGIPRPTGLASLREAFERFNVLRQASTPPPPPAVAAPPPGTESFAGPTATGPSAAPAAGSSASATVSAWALATPQVEVVLFQDCWMATLETAYELADVVHYVIASQSLIPIGTAYADFIWPYEQLLKDLLAVDFAEQLTAHVGDFYDSNFSEIETLISVPIALLDLSAVTAMTSPLKALVTSLKSALTMDQRAPVIEGGQIVAFDIDSNITAGDCALMDVQRMCGRMLAHPDPGISAAALSVLPTLGPLIKVSRESVPTGGAPVGFGGVSLLYRPPDPPLDEYITQALRKASYLALKFSKATNWPATEQQR